MQRFLILARRELSSIILNPPTLFAAAFFILLDSFAFYLASVRTPMPTASFHAIASFMLYTSILLYPFAARHSFSAESANGTLEALFTAPVARITVVLAKYAALMLFVFLYLTHGLVYAILFAQGGTLDWATAGAAFAALAAVGSLAMAVSVFVSALTPSPAAATAGAAGILFCMALAADLDPYSGIVADVLHEISFVPHAKRWIGGLLDTQGLVFFLTLSALFLFCAWLAVTTQEHERRPHDATVRRRLTITYLLVCAGFFLLLFEAAILNIGGYWDAGGQLGHNIFRIPRAYLIPPALAVGVFLWSFFTWRAAQRAHRHGRKKHSTNKYATISESKVQRAPRYYYEENVRIRRRTAIATLAALVVIVNLNWLAHYPFETFADGGKLSCLAALRSRSRDVTRERKNTLAPATLNALDSLQGKLYMYSFLSERLRIQNVPVASDFRALVARYADTSALVSAVYADTGHEPEFARELALELDLPPENLKNKIVVSYQGRHMILPASSLAVAPDYRRIHAGDSRWVFDGETLLTQAILHLIDPRVPRIFFTYGHLEHSQSAAAVPSRSISLFVQALAAANMRPRQHSFASGPIPDDCDVLAIIAPRIPFREHEAAEIQRYLDNGGRLLAIASPPDQEYDVDVDALNTLLFSMGGSFRNDRIRDAEHNDGDPDFLFGRIIAGNSESARLLFPDARSIRDNPRSSEQGWNARRTAQTFPTAIASEHGSGEKETAQEGSGGKGSGSGPETRTGPFTLAYRTTRHTASGEARALVLSSAAAVTNAYIRDSVNLDLLVANVQWLAGREEATDIETQPWVDRRLRLTGPQIRMFVWIALVALPLFWLAAGISAWWLRRE